MLVVWWFVPCTSGRTTPALGLCGLLCCLTFGSEHLLVALDQVPVDEGFEDPSPQASKQLNRFGTEIQRS